MNYGWINVDSWANYITLGPMDFQPHLTPAPMGQAPLFLNVFVSHAWQEGFDEFVQYVVARLGPLGFGISGFPQFSMVK